ncbi:MAG: SDR family NAD(P)-dependent oxidoreductase [Actinomycetota bacterium]
MKTPKRLKSGNWDWHDRVCVVTGASSGIGNRLARDLARSGATVCAVARRSDRLEELVGELDPGRHSFVTADVAERDDVRTLRDHVESTYGRCDVLVNNAGVAGESDFDGPAALADLERVMAVNFFGAAYCTAELLELLAASAPSHVVNIASVAGKLTWGGASAYCASKFALVGWSESLYFELARKGVHVGVVEPGPVPTEGFPQRDLKGDPWLRYAMTSDAGVSAAIRRVVERGKMERVVPRWYYLLQVPRLLVPPVYRFANRRILSRAGRPT